MGCNQSTLNTVPEVQISEVPCQPDDIGKYLNEFRANPSALAAALEKQISKFTDQYSLVIGDDILYRTNEGREVWKQTIKFLKEVRPLPPLTKHEGLCKAAQLHAEDLSHMKELTHTGSDGCEPLDRVAKFCRKGFGKTGENIGTDFKLKDRNYAENTVVGLVIDDGVSDRGHRLSVFDPDFNYFGSATRVQGDKVITVINYLSRNWEPVNRTSI